MEEAIGLTFVIGILGMGASFIAIYMKSNASFCKRISYLEMKVENLINMVESLRDDRDRFHPRKE